MIPYKEIDIIFFMHLQKVHHIGVNVQRYISLFIKFSEEHRI